MAGLTESWGLEIERLRYLPKGFGSYHWLAETSGGHTWFVTVDDLDVKPWLGSDRDSTFAGLEAAYGTAWILREQAQLPFVVAPVPGTDGQLVRHITSRYSVAAFPFVDGHAGTWGQAPTPPDRDEVLHRLVDLHRATPRVETRARRRGVELPGRASLERALEEVDRPWTGGAFSEAARGILATHRVIVREWLTSFDRLAALVSAASGALVVTHGEPHPGNLIRSDDGLVLIDWDTVALARPERDLWMLDDGSPESLELYREETGRPINETAIAFYRLAWTLADISAFIAVFRAPHDENDGTDKTWKALNESLSGTPPRPYGPAPPGQ